MVSWHLGARATLVRRTGAGLRYGVVLWSLRLHGVRCVRDCGKQKKHTHKKSQPWPSRHALNYNDRLSFIGKDYFASLLICLFYSEKVICVCAQSATASKMKEGKKSGRTS